MGLDIMFKRTSVSFKGDRKNIDDISAFCNKAGEDAKDRFGAFVEGELYLLKKAWDKYYEVSPTAESWNNNERSPERDEYDRLYNEFLERLKPWFTYSYEIRRFTEAVLPLPSLRVMLRSRLDYYCPQDKAYFRKVNCLYAYYRRIGKMVDRSVAITDREDIEDIIQRCRMIREDHSLARELLPTQDGFFFGSTEYDDEYFSEIDDIIDKMTKFLDEWEEGETAYVIFSW